MPRLVLLLLALSAGSVMAEEQALRPSATLLFKQPALMRVGSCVQYREGGAAWVVGEPAYYLRGRVVYAEIKARRLQSCPEVPGKQIGQYSRAEFNRQARAYPCLAAGVPEQSVQLGVVRVQVDDWETPHARRAENAGRLYRGTFIDQTLQKGLEIELEADLLEPCEP